MSAHAEDFLIGWRKLPDELKVQVLRYVLPSGFVISHFIFTDTPRLESGNYPKFREDILPVLACSEIATLSIEVLYGQNASLLVDWGLSPYNAQKLPPKAVRKFVRHWGAIIPIEQIYSQEFRTVVNSLDGFPTPASIGLFILGYSTRIRISSPAPTMNITQQRLMAMDPLELNTNKLSIVYSIGGSRRYRDLADAVQRSLTISGERKSVKQKCERRIITYGEGSKETTRTIDAAWPEVLLKGQSRQVMITVWR